MPYQAVKLNPGIDIEKTAVLNQGGWSDSQLIRWEEGLPQKLGGWAKYYNASFNSPIRALHAWLANSHVSGSPESADTVCVAVGGEQTLSLIEKTSSGNLIDGRSLTPRVATINPNASPPTPVTFTFSTTAGSTTVGIHSSVVHNLTTFSSINIKTPVTIGGITLVGPYNLTTSNFTSTDYTIQSALPATSTASSSTGLLPTFNTSAGSPLVTVNMTNTLLPGQEVSFQTPTVVDPNITINGTYRVQSANSTSYTITASKSAQNSAGPTAMNGGYVQIDYYQIIGPTTGAVAWGDANTGWGGFVPPPPLPNPGTVAISWGGYGSATQTPIIGSPISTIGWTLDNWGTYLVACADNGPIYWWDPASGNGVAGLLTSAPMTNHGIFVSMPLQILIAYGSTDINGVHDPLLVRWCDQANFNQWMPQSTNQAGSYRIPEGSEIICGLSIGQQSILWTDIETWSMTYIGQPFVFGFNKISMASGIVSRHAACQLMDQTFWMGQGNFFMLSANGVQEVPCTVWDQVYQNINRAAAFKVCCAPNSIFNEISWFYPSAATIPSLFNDASQTGNTNSNTTINNLSANVLLFGWKVGMLVNGTGIPVILNAGGVQIGPIITAIANDGLSIQISSAATATATGVHLTVSSLDPSTGENDSYVKFSLANNAWDFGTLQRTAWIDQSPAGAPIGADATGYTYQHEVLANGTPLFDADGVAMQTSITTAWFLISEGDPVTFVDLILPDFRFGFYPNPVPRTAQLQITIMTADWPSGPVHTLGPYLITASTKWLNVRARGRMMRCTISSSDLGSFWRLGNLRYRGIPDGRRGD